MESVDPEPIYLPGLTLHNVDWETYCKLRDDPEHDRMRMTYLDGTLTILLPGYRNDIESRRLFMLLTAVFRAWRVNFLMIGGTTLRKAGGSPLEGAGKEPDDGFYLGGVEAKVRGNVELDLAVDPPPGLVIDVHDRADIGYALPTYARLGVTEVLVYKVSERTLWFGRLAGEGCEEIGRSLGLPRLTPSLVLDAMDDPSGEMGNLEWCDWLDAWARTLPEPPEGGP